MIRNLFSSLLYVDDPTVLNDTEMQLEVDIMREVKGESENETTENTKVSAKSRQRQQSRMLTKKTYHRQQKGRR